MKPQIIKTTCGEEMVIIPLSDYQALLDTASEAMEEAAADIALFDQRMAELAGNGSDTFPLEISAAMMKGESLLKALRGWRDMTQSQVAKTVGIGQGHFSEIEKGYRRGSSNVLSAIAHALRIPEKWLI